MRCLQITVPLPGLLRQRHALFLNDDLLVQTVDVRGRIGHPQAQGFFALMRLHIELFKFRPIAVTARREQCRNCLLGISRRCAALAAHDEQDISCRHKLPFPYPLFQHDAGLHRNDPGNPRTRQYNTLALRFSRIRKHAEKSHNTNCNCDKKTCQKPQCD